jgi:3-hydroxyacyl-CoA dehydrogenase
MPPRCAGWQRIQSNLQARVTRGKLTKVEADAVIASIVPVAELETAVREADLVIEAVVEDSAVKQRLFHAS